MKSTSKARKKPTRIANKFVENWCENYHLSTFPIAYSFHIKSFANVHKILTNLRDESKREEEKKSTLRKTNNFDF